MALLNIRPVDRYEKFLARMAGDGSVAMPIPRDRKEKFMKAIAENINRGGGGGTGETLTKEEMLAILNGGEN